MFLFKHFASSKNIFSSLSCFFKHLTIVESHLHPFSSTISTLPIIKNKGRYKTYKRGETYENVSPFSFENDREVYVDEEVFKFSEVIENGYNFFEYPMDVEPGVNEKLLTSREKLIELIDRLLEDILEATKDMGKGNSKFHAKQIPAMSVLDYLTRMSKYSHCSNAAYVLSLIYMDRLQETVEIFLNRYCIHKLLITSIVVAAKYNDDEFYKNVYYAKVGGISLEEMNMLEQHFATLLDYNFFVSPYEFNTYLNKLGQYEDIHKE